MVEFIPDSEYDGSLQLDPGDFYADAYFLMAIYLSSQHFQEIDAEDHADAEPPYSGTRYWGDVAEGFERHRIPRLLMSLAATLRQQNDYAGWWIDRNCVVGELIDDIEAEDIESRPLEL